MTTEVQARDAVRIRTMRPGDDMAIVALLNAAYPGGWGTLERWRAKHSERPGFDPQDIYLAEMDGRLVGCLHTAIIPVRIMEGLTLSLSLDGDLAVHPDARRHAIPETLYAESRRRLHERGIPLRGGFTEAGLWTRFYQPRIGYISDFDRTVNFKKVLDAAPVTHRLLALFGAAPDVADPGHGPALEVAITGLDPFQIRLGTQTVARIESSRHTKPSLRLVADQRLLGVFGKEGGGMREMVGLWRAGGLKIRGGLGGRARVAWWCVMRGRHLIHRPAGPASRKA